MYIRSIYIVGLLIFAGYVAYDLGYKKKQPFLTLLWLMLTFFFQVFAIPVYFFFSHNLEKTPLQTPPPIQGRGQLCPKCGQENEFNTETCQHCGNQLKI